MQTFLPYSNFRMTAEALDRRRLGKQRVEALQILNALTVPGHGWRNHPPVLMWRGHEEALVRYGLDVCAVWCELGFNDTCATKLTDAARTRLDIAPIRTQAELDAAGALPPWLGDEDLHRSHRASLLRKDPEHYRAQFDDEPDDPDYVWPVRRESTG